MTRPRRVLHLAPGHAALDTRVFWKECRSLARAGYDVRLLVPHDRDEVRDGVTISALPRWTTRVQRFVRNPLVLARRAWAARVDVVHLHDIEALPVGILLALRGRTVVYDSHEDYPRLALDRPWIPAALRPFVARTVALLERAATRTFSAVVSAEEEGARRFPPDKVTVVRNHPLGEELDRVDVTWEERERRALYVGDITAQRGAREMVEAIGRVHPPARLTLVGRINPPDLAEELAGLPGWSQVDLLGPQGRDRVVAELARAKVGLVLWHPTAKHAQGAVPVKLFEYMGAGLAVVGSDLPTIRAAVDRADAGHLVDPRDVEAVVASIEDLLGSGEAPGARGQEAVRQHHTWATEERRLLYLYRRLTGPEPSAASATRTAGGRPTGTSSTA